MKPLQTFPKPLGHFQPNLAQSIGFNFFLYEGPTPLQRGDNYKIVKMHWQILKSSPELLDKFYPNLTRSLLRWREFTFLYFKGQIQKCDNCKIVNYYWICQKSMLQISWISSRLLWGGTVARWATWPMNLLLEIEIANTNASYGPDYLYIHVLNFKLLHLNIFFCIKVHSLNFVKDWCSMSNVTSQTLVIKTPNYLNQLNWKPTFTFP